MSLKTYLLAAFAMALFLAATLPTEPLFYMNQHTKFLHGFAAADVGFLAQDWTANTKNGLPVFTAIVRAVAETGQFWLFYVLQFLCFLGYALAILGVVRVVLRHRPTAPSQFVWAVTIILALHAFHPLADLWQGVADQYVLDRVFEPASFGFLAVGAVPLWLFGHPIWAALALVGASLIHPGYTLPGALLLIGFAITGATANFRPRHWLIGLAIGVAGLAANTAAIRLAFPATTPDLYAEAMSILTEFRIPAHSLVSHWFDIDAAAKLVFVTLAAALLFRDPLGRILATMLAVVILLTLISINPDTATLRLIAPWRASVVMVPIANAALVALLAIWLDQRFATGRKTGLWIWRGAIGFLVVAALAYNAIKKPRDYTEDRSPPYYDWVAANAEAGDVYLTPVNWIDFRLTTGAAQYVTFKSHPYIDTEVIEWRDRVRNVRSLYGAQDPCDAARTLSETGAFTHVFMPNGVDCDGMARLYSDDEQSLYAVTAPTMSGN